jgi:hypothetical protein
LIDASALQCRAESEVIQKAPEFASGAFSASSQEMEIAGYTRF